jgi:DNA-binding MarR family transcriptional regulator
MRAVEARMLTEHGLSANDFETLLHLSRSEHGAMRRIDLAEELRLTPSGVTRLLDGLEAAGLTGRRSCEQDARVTYAVITDEGRELLARAGCSHAAACDELIGGYLAPAELDELASLLGRLPGVEGVDATSCSGGPETTG